MGHCVEISRMKTKTIYSLSTLFVLTLLIMLFRTNNTFDRSFKESSPSNFLKIVNPVDIDFSPYNFICTTSKFTSLRYPLCVYIDNEGTYINQQDKIMINTIMEELNKDPSLQILDLGANVGVYSLTVGHLNRSVVSVEPNFDTVLRLAKSVMLGNLTKYVTIFHNAISNEHATLEISINTQTQEDTRVKEINATCPQGAICPDNRNVQAITLDDLIPFVKSPVIIKADVQGHEIKAFNKGAHTFFSVIKVPMIFIEWVLYPQGVNSGVWKKEDIDQWLEFFYSRKYSVYSANNIKLDSNWMNWPSDVVFKKV
jgi:FkbM family methyltransferase